MTKISNYKSYSLKVLYVLLAFFAIFQSAYADAPNPPTNVQATDGEFFNKVVVTWSAPASPVDELVMLYLEVLQILLVVVRLLLPLLVFLPFLMMTQQCQIRIITTIRWLLLTI